MRMTCLVGSIMLVFVLPTSGQQQQAPTTALPTPRVGAPRPPRPLGSGTIMGYVYWDSSAVKHTPAKDCTGIAVTVSAGGSSLGTFSSGHFAYITDVGTLSVCAYAIDQMPVGTNLEVQVSVTTPAAFSPSMLAASGAASINITGGTTFNKCSQLPSAVPSAADLSQSWYTCASHAYNVNFLLTSAKVPLGANRMAVGKVPPGAAQTTNPSSSQGTLLAPGAQKTLLGGQANAPGDGGGKSGVPGVERPTTTDGGKSGLPAVQRSATVDGSFNGGTRVGSGGAVGPGQTMSAQGNVPTSPTKGAGSSALATGPSSSLATSSLAAQQRTTGSVSPAAYTSATCAKDPTFRILGLMDNSTGVVTYEHSAQLNLSDQTWTDLLTQGRVFTIFGCSFGNASPMKGGAAGSAPVNPQPSPQPSMSARDRVVLATNQAQHIEFDLNTQSWSDNSIVFAVPNLSSDAITRLDGVVLRLAILLSGGRGTLVYVDRKQGAPQTTNPGPTQAQGTLLAPGGQKTLLGPQANPSAGDGGKAGLPAVQRSATVDGSFNGGTRVGSGGTISPGQTMSVSGNSASSPASTSRAAAIHPSSGGSSATRGSASAASVTGTVSGAYVAAACAKDPTFRILGVSGTPDGVTLTGGQQYTISGCSFGDTLHAKAPAVPHSPAGSTGSINTTQVPNTVYLEVSSFNSFECDALSALGPVGASFRSWSDNSILMTPVPDTGWDLNCPATLYVRRADGQTTSMDGFHYETPPSPPPPPLPATPALAAQTCAHDNTFRIIAIYDTYGSGVVTQLRPDTYYTIAGCSFGKAGPGSQVRLFGEFDTRVTTETGTFTRRYPFLVLFPFSPNGDYPFVKWNDNAIVIFVPYMPQTELLDEGLPIRHALEVTRDGFTRGGKVELDGISLVNP